MKKIAVIGSANMDLILTVDRFPNEGETVLGKDYKNSFGGKGSNQAIAINRLGGDVSFFVRLGKDDNGEKIKQNFANENLAAEINWSGKHTGFATIINHQGNNRIMVFSGANMESSSEYESKIQHQLNDFDIILLQCEISPNLNYVVAKWAHEHGKIVVLNPAPVDKFEDRILPFVDYLIPNETESKMILAKNKDFEPSKIITTLGGHGASYNDNGQTQIIKPLTDLNVVDTTGAGDSFVGGFVYGLANEFPIDKCVRIGNITGGKSTEKLGATTGMINKFELDKFI